MASPEEWGLLKTTAITWQGWDPTAHKVPPKEYWKNYRLEVKAGDVLVTKAGPRHRVGVVVYVDKTPRQLMVSGKMVGLRPDATRVNYQILAAALSQREPQRFLDSRTSGMADSQLNFTNDLLLNTMITLPPKPEQTKIAEVLSTVDRAIEQIEAQIAKQQRIKTGLMQDLLTRGIDEQGSLRSEVTHEFKDSPLGRIPVEWEVSPAHALCIAVIDCKNRTPPVQKDGYPVIRTPNVRAGKFVFEDLSFTDSRSYEIWTARGKPKVGDVVITREAPFGEACIIPEEVSEACLGQRMMLYRPNPNKLDNEFLLFAIYSEQVQKRLLELAGGSTVGHIRVGDIRDLAIPHPTALEEQERVASVLSEIANGLDQHCRAVRKLYRTKTALMQDLLTGEKRVTPLLEAGNAARSTP